MTTTGSAPASGVKSEVLAIDGLRVGLSARPGVDVVDDICLVLTPGEIVGLVGESGSGKTTVGTSLLAYSRAGAVFEAGQVMFQDKDVLTASPNEVRKLRGADIAYVPQDPGAALNPSIRIGRQMVELLELRRVGTAESRLQAARERLAEVSLPTDDEFLRRYPHQLSGGQVQRVALAMAFLPRPKVLVLDEPTTGLDVTTQGMVLQTMKQLCIQHGVAALYVTHDLAVVATTADRVAVMYAGQIVELGGIDTIFNSPAHPYTRALLDSIPHLREARRLRGIPGRTPSPGARPPGCRFSDRCAFATANCTSATPPLTAVGAAHSVRCIRHAEIGGWNPVRWSASDSSGPVTREPLLSIEHLDVFYGKKQVVFDVSISVAKSETVALVGESGSGKTTISRCVGGLLSSWSGTMSFDGGALQKGSRRRSAADRKRVQYIFQNPYLSLNPRLTIEQIVRRPMELFGLAKGREATERVVDLLEQVALGPGVLRYAANRLSGGERQRVAIARALASEPELLVCDEITSALDVSVQGSIVELLEGLKASRGVSLLFVTHNLALVRSIADRVEILNGGRLVESGAVGDVLDTPQDEYTRRLLANTPRIT